MCHPLRRIPLESFERVMLASPSLGVARVGRSGLNRSHRALPFARISRRCQLSALIGHRPLIRVATNGFHACPTAGVTGNTCTMKTAILLPDELCQEIDACARELKTSRSRVLARAARDFLERHQEPAAATAAWNRAIARAGQPGEDPAARAFRRRSKAVIRARAR